MEDGIKIDDIVKYAVDFYALESMWSKMQYESTGFLQSKIKFKEALQELRKEHHSWGARTFTKYLTMAAGGEARHYAHQCRSRKKPVSKIALKQLVAWGIIVPRSGCPGSKQDIVYPDGKPKGRCEANSAVSKLEGTSRRKFLGFVKGLFGKTMWNEGYGGKKWVTITDTVLMHEKGDIDDSVFCDIVFDLRHNGDILFDKNTVVRGEAARLPAILSIKKKAVSTSDLLKRYAHYASYWDIGMEVSYPVNALYNRGVVLGFWSDYKEKGVKNNAVESVKVEKQQEGQKEESENTDGDTNESTDRSS